MWLLIFGSIYLYPSIVIQNKILYRYENFFLMVMIQKTMPGVIYNFLIPSEVYYLMS